MVYSTFHPASVSSLRTKGGGYTLAGRWGGGEVNILEDARHRIGLLQYNLSTVSEICYCCPFFNAGICTGDEFDVIGYYSHPCDLFVYVFKDLRDQQSIIYNTVIDNAKIRRLFLYFSICRLPLSRALGAEWSQDYCIPVMSNKVRLKTSNGGFMACVAFLILQPISIACRPSRLNKVHSVFLIYLAVVI